MRQEDRSLELADKTRLIMKNYKEVLSMKDKIKKALVTILLVINTPFFLVRTLMAVIPMIIGFCIAVDDTGIDAPLHIWCCMVEALWLSGPIGLLHEYCRHTWFGISFRQDINDLEECLKKDFDE